MASKQYAGATSYYDGANPGTWWEKYGEGKGGRLEVSVGDDYQCIMMDARGYETVGELPLRNLTDSEGNQYRCYTSIQGMDSSVPKREACALLDGWPISTEPPLRERGGNRGRVLVACSPPAIRPRQASTGRSPRRWGP